MANAETRAPRLGVARLLSWGLALVAIAFVWWMTPVRDRCWDARVPNSTHVSVTRDALGCVLHVPSGEVAIQAEECAKLKCEPGLLSTFGRARFVIVGGLFGLYVLATLAWAARWRALMSFAGIDLSLMQVWRITIEAQAGGILLPGGIGGDALRIAAVAARPTRPGEARAPVSIVVASVLLDRAVGLALIAGIAASVGFASGGISSGPLVGLLAAIPVAILAGLVCLRHAPILRIRRMSQGRIGRVAGPVLAYVRDPRAPRAIATSAGLGFVVSGANLAIIRGLVLALGAEPTTEKWIYVGTAMAFIVAVIPALPGGWGTVDAAYVFFFGLAGLGSGVALGVCLLFRLFWYVLAVAGALLYASRVRRGTLARAP